ncbi:Xyloglucan endotransglucosylase/hydrolase protein [Thalictrum thalictroides]|uniref:Xyloglucan endotransglucosylase/hydrolase n=1 Tax=Thalictrum thalictroides TaxID=46969 RepID=A0A7J6W872_THATH|nr:Xyloglucan endotransglucosylase/hydrolase protein [Thalictrum thalictroides]
MDLFLTLCLILIVPLTIAQPSPGYWPSSKFKTIDFNQGYRTLWGPQHQKLEQNSLTIWLDRNSGSGFKSNSAFRSGYFGAAMKLHPGYTAGVITSFYLSNNEEHPGNHDEVDIEFLGTTPGKPYTLQTNVYVRGSGDGQRLIGREVKFNLWFDPTANYHYYAILWSPNDIIFFVDDIPIRRYRRKIDSTFPIRPMWVYGSIWDASSWATEDGKYKADYSYQPFIGRYNSFKLSGCTENAPASCRPVSGSPYPSGGLSTQQNIAMQWAQKYQVYDYCKDYKRDHSQTPECYAN